MNGIIDTGGGLRGVFGTGVFDRCLEENINFEYLLGVSAGAANIASFLGKQNGRNLLFYTEYAMRSEYMGFSNILKNGCYLDLDYVYRTLSNSDGENPLNYGNFNSFDGTFLTVTTDAETGKAIYWAKSAYLPDDYTVLKASSCLPIVCKPQYMGSKRCFDGGIADPVPIEKAIQDGCEKTVVILTRPVQEIKKQGVDKKAAMLLKRKYPNLSIALENRYNLYNAQVEKIKEYEKEGKVLIIAPDSLDGMKTLTRDKEKLKKLYENGREQANKIKKFLSD